MKKPIYLTAAFFIVMLLYLAYPAYLIATHENTLSTGQVFRFKPRPVDPYDAFRGKYIVLSYEENSLTYPNAMETFDFNSKVYLEVNTDAQGFAKITNAYTQTPDFSNYIATNVNYVDSNTIYYNLPFDRYYLNEYDAPVAEQAYNDILRQQNRNDSTTVAAYIDVRVKNGLAIIEELYLQNQLIKEYLEGLKRLKN
ncbi:MAG: GDYXXLXY domain-containing protein [Chitinophagales bacterium]